MNGLRCKFTSCRVACASLAILMTLGGSQVSSRAEQGFPFDQELLLDTKPMRGSKRVPMLDIAANGAVLIDLWCNTVEGQIVLIEKTNTIAVLTGSKTDRSCPPERARGDEEMLSLLTQITSWRREGDALVLVGPQTLRFRRATN